MRKVVLVGLLAITAMANENGWYIGGDISRVQEVAKQIDLGVEDVYTNTSAAYSILAGYYFNENSRTYAFYQKINKGTFSNPTKAYGAGYDYLFGNLFVKPFIGAIVGYSRYDSGIVLKGPQYGVRVGLDYKLSDNVSFDVGYRHVLSDAEYKEGDIYTNESTSFQSYFAGVNYKF